MQMIHITSMISSHSQDGAELEMVFFNNIRKNEMLVCSKFHLFFELNQIERPKLGESFFT